MNIYLQKLNFWGRGLFTSGACDALNIKPGFDKDDCWLQEIQPFKGSVT